MISSLSEYQLLTGGGPAAIAVVRIRGPAVEIFLQKHLRTRRPPAAEDWTPGRVWRGALLDADGAAIDDLLISVHAPPPRWDLRLHLHGSPWVVRRCAELLTACGLREQKEEISSLWRARDALEAEADALLPRMQTEPGARWLLKQVELLRSALESMIARASRNFIAPRAPQFSGGTDKPADESSSEANGFVAGLSVLSGAASSLADECRAILSRAAIFDWFAKPLRVALVGPPNAGKSTLANALADQPASLVSPVPGTTRDWVEIAAEARGFPVAWIDTAGLRVADDPLEAAGVARTRRLIAEADVVVIVLDINDLTTVARSVVEPAVAMTREFLRTYADLQPAAVALNKSDLLAGAAAPVDRSSILAGLPPAWRGRAVFISAAQRTGLEKLAEVLFAGVGRDLARFDLPSAFTPRQVRHLEAACAAADAREFKAVLFHCLNEPRER